MGELCEAHKDVLMFLLGYLLSALRSPKREQPMWDIIESFREEMPFRRSLQG